MALVVKNPPCQYRRRRRAGFNPWVRKIPLEKGMATHSSILVENPIDRGAWGYSPWDHKELDKTKQLSRQRSD